MRREIVHEAGQMHDALFVDMDQLKAHADWCQARQKEGLTEVHGMRILGEIPGEFVEAYCNKNGVTFQEWMQNPEHARIMLRDPALAHFRIHPGKI